MSIRCFVTFLVFLTCTCEFLEFIVVEKESEAAEKTFFESRNQDASEPPAAIILPRFRYFERWTRGAFVDPFNHFGFRNPVFVELFEEVEYPCMRTENKKWRDQHDFCFIFQDFYIGFQVLKTEWKIHTKVSLVVWKEREQKALLRLVFLANSVFVNL